MACEVCVDPKMIQTLNQDDPSSASTPYALGDFDDHNMRIIALSNGNFAWTYYETNGDVYVQLFSFDSSHFATFGSRSNVGNMDLTLADSPLQIFEVNAVRLGVLYPKDYSAGAGASYYPVITIVTFSGLTVSSFSENDILDSYERGAQGADMSGALARMLVGGAWCDDSASTEIDYLVPYRPLDGSCATTTTDQLCLLTGDVGGSGNTITWNDTTCTNGGSNTVRDWQVVDSNDHNGDILKFINSGETPSNKGMALWNRSGLRMRVYDASGASWGTEITLADSAALTPVTGGLIALSSSLYVAWCVIQDTTSYLYAWAVSLSGTTLTGGARKEIYSTTDSAPKHAQLTKTSTTSFAATGDSVDITTSPCICEPLYDCSISGTTITVDASEAYWIDNDSYLIIPDYGSASWIAELAVRDIAGNSGVNECSRVIDIGLADTAYSQGGGYWSRP